LKYDFTNHPIVANNYFLDKIFSGNKPCRLWRKAQRLMMEAEMVSETLGFYPQLTGLLTEKIL
jgi:hypothetical protein